VDADNTAETRAKEKAAAPAKGRAESGPAQRLRALPPQSAGANPCRAPARYSRIE